MPKESMPRAIVMACRGGAQGDLGVVRTLGRAGVPVSVLAEYPDAPASHSRYCREVHLASNFARERRAAVAELLALADREPAPPVVFPTADPDLRMLSDCRERLEPSCRLFLSERPIVEACLDKSRFHEYVAQFDVPVPATRVPEDRAALLAAAGELRYPVILKPAKPDSWNDSRITQIVAGKKAVVAHDADELLAFYDGIAPFGNEIVLQEYIPGRDDRLYSLHAYISREGKPLALFTGQKIRTWPTYAGIGCFVRSVYVPEIIASGTRLLQDMGYTGVALLQFKRDEKDGVFKLLEINPRASSWNLLAYACGVNIPYAAYCDAAGLPTAPMPRQREGVRYIYFGHDRKAFLDYRRHGDCSWSRWLRSLVGRNVYQYFAGDDPGPWITLMKQKLTASL
jgi:predicted ATP-grasp superfamily ATP-dependent carboligase